VVNIVQKINLYMETMHYARYEIMVPVSLV